MRLSLGRSLPAALRHLGDFVPDLPKVGIKTILRGAVGQVGEQLIPAEVMASCPERMGSGRSLSGEDACELIELNSGSWDHSSAATFFDASGASY